MEPFQTAAQRKVIAELGVLALQVLDALLGLRYGFDRIGIAVGDLVGQPLDLKIRTLQGGNSAAMLSGPLLKAVGLGIERRKLADERARLAGEDPAPRRPEPPQTEQKHRGPKH